MKKLFIALSFSLPLMFVACETEEETNSTGNNDNGFWDVECTSSYDSVVIISYDSVWVSDSNAGYWETQCDSIVVYDSSQNASYERDCKQVWVGGNSQNGHYEYTNCKTIYDVTLIENCDSVWVTDNSNQTDSTNTTDGSSNGVTQTDSTNPIGN